MKAFMNKVTASAAGILLVGAGGLMALFGLSVLAFVSMLGLAMAAIAALVAPFISLNEDSASESEEADARFEDTVADAQEVAA
ncbi:MAG: hypothetical protein MK107_10445 [Oceanicola sp.]|nr:hypothetical protein [Oceanicola sp.]